MNELLGEKKLVISAVPVNLLPVIWPRVEEMIDMAIAHSNEELSISSIYNKLLEGDMLLVTINEGDSIVAALTLERRHFDTGKDVLNVVTAGGADMHIWVEEMDDILQKLAKQFKCEEIYIVGRQGWVRTLRDLGYQRVHTTLSKRVE